MSFVEVLPPELTGPDHPEWFEARRQGVTASEIPVILGLSPWDSAFALYWRKRGTMPEQADTNAMRWGRRLEAVVAEEFRERHQEFVMLGAGLYAHESRLWQLASPDRLLCEGMDIGQGGIAPVAVVEVKTAGSWDDWGPDGTDEVPAHIRAQVIWQLDVCGLEVGYVAVLVAGRSYREYEIKFDAADADFMRLRGWYFLKAVWNGQPPDVDAAPATLDTLRRLHPDLEGTEVMVPRTLAQRYRAACRNTRRAETSKRLVENLIRARMGAARTALDPDGGKLATRIRYDRKPYQVGPSTVDVLRPTKEPT